MNRSITQDIMLLIGAFIAFTSLPSRAATVELKIQPNNLIASADYKSGKPGMPAVILIHGFLQTRDSPTIRRLADELTNTGFTTLAPTLSLGVSRRTQSLSCEAIHTHTMQSDSRETEKWIAWLTAQGHKNIVLVGHSRGNNAIQYYLSGKPASSVKKGIMLSIVDDDSRAIDDKRQAMTDFAQQKIKAEDKGLYPYKTSFCNKYMSTAEGYLSYFDSTRSKTLKTLKTSKRPVDIILGGLDDRMGKDWPDILKSHGQHVTVIKEGNHFFDGLAEFELAETVSNSLSGLKIRN